MKTIARVWSIAAVLLLVSSTALVAQNIRPGVVELGASGGASTISGALNQKPTYSFGFSGTYSVSHKVWVGPEYTYDILGSSIIAGTTSTLIASDLQQFGALVRVALIDRKSKFVPYMVGSGGLATYHGPTSASSHLRGFTPGGYVTAGAGLDYYWKHGFGIRPELRVDYNHFKGGTGSTGGLTALGDSTRIHGTLGIFYQF